MVSGFRLAIVLACFVLVLACLFGMVCGVMWDSAKIFWSSGIFGLLLCATIFIVAIQS